MHTIFKCANPKCHNTVDANALNKVQLKVLRRVPVTCESCGHRTKWLETVAMFGNETKSINVNGGSKSARKITTPDH